MKNRRIIMEQRQKNVDKFRKYLQDSGISTAFKIIMTEIVQKEIPEDQVF